MGCIYSLDRGSMDRNFWRRMQQQPRSQGFGRSSAIKRLQPQTNKPNFVSRGPSMAGSRTSGPGDEVDAAAGHFR